MPVSFFPFWLGNGSTAGYSNDGYALQGSGLTSNNIGASAQASTLKFTFSSSSTAAGTNLGYSTWMNCAASNTTLAVFSGGGGTNGSSTTAITTTSKYTFSGDSVAAGTALGTARKNHASSSSSTVAYFVGGRNASDTRVATTDKYTYSGDSVSAGTSITTARDTHYGFGNSTYGFFTAGYDGASTLTSTYRYAYSGDSVASKTATATRKSSQANVAGGNMTFSHPDYGFVLVGHDGGSYLTSCQKYTIADDTVTSTVAAGRNRVAGSAASNAVIGVLDSGDNGTTNPITTTDKYTINDNAWSTSSFLGYFATAMASNYPGGLRA